MQNLTDLFRLIELTRSVPQYGYALSGIRQDELSNLAEHHYLVTFIAWQLASNLNSLGAKLDVLKVVEYTLIHDLGEIFGGDISLPYAVANPQARTHAKAFEAENLKFMARYFGSQKEKFLRNSLEVLDARSDECLVAKVADFMECVYFKLYAEEFAKEDLTLAEPKLLEKISIIKDEVANRELTAFIRQWISQVATSDLRKILNQ